MSFSIEQLLAFVTVYEERSFSKAAAKLNKHRTTTGQVIANLEDVLAVELFERIGRKVEPTEEGRLLYHYAKATIDQSNIFDKIALSLAYGAIEGITFAYSSVVPHGILSKIRTQLSQDFPNMKVNLCIASSLRSSLTAKTSLKTRSMSFHKGNDKVSLGLDAIPLLERGNSSPNRFVSSFFISTSSKPDFANQWADAYQLLITVWQSDHRVLAMFERNERKKI